MNRDKKHIDRKTRALLSLSHPVCFFPETVTCFFVCVYLFLHLSPQVFICLFPLCFLNVFLSIFLSFCHIKYTKHPQTNSVTEKYQLTGWLYTPGPVMFLLILLIYFNLRSTTALLANIRFSLRVIFPIIIKEIFVVLQLLFAIDISSTEIFYPGSSYDSLIVIRCRLRSALKTQRCSEDAL